MPQPPSLFPLLLWPHAPRLAALNIIAVICGGLALDAALGWPGQSLTVLWTLAVFSWLYSKGGIIERRVLILCLVISGIGEVILSLVWGLYDYQFHNVPLFVPPGHALLMTLGILLANSLVTHPFGRVFLRLIPWTAFIYAVFAAYSQRDEFGALLFVIFAACMIFGRAKMLYACMFVLALAMEIYGTLLGNWQWHSLTPMLNLTAANPPFSAGAFYCLLDLLVLAALPLWPLGNPSAALENTK